MICKREGCDNRLGVNNKYGFCRTHAILRDSTRTCSVVACSTFISENNPTGYCSVHNYKARSRTDNRNRRAEHLLKTFNMTEDDYDNLVLSQYGLCLICDEWLGTTENCVIDHDRKCCPDRKSCGRCVRGVLHRPCNLEVAWYERSVDKIARIELYVNTHKEVEHVATST